MLCVGGGGHEEPSLNTWAIEKSIGKFEMRYIVMGTPFQTL